LLKEFTSLSGETGWFVWLILFGKVCAVNAEEAHRGYLSGKILVLIISELCFAKQYPCCAPAKKFKIAHKKIPRTSTRDITKLTNPPSLFIL